MDAIAAGTLGRIQAAVRLIENGGRRIQPVAQHGAADAYAQPQAPPHFTIEAAPRLG